MVSDDARLARFRSHFVNKRVVLMEDRFIGNSASTFVTVFWTSYYSGDEVTQLPTSKRRRWRESYHFSETGYLED